MTPDEEFLAIEEAIKWLIAHAAEFFIPEHYARYLASNLARQKEAQKILTNRR